MADVLTAMLNVVERLRRNINEYGLHGLCNNLTDAEYVNAEAAVRNGLLQLRGTAVERGRLWPLVREAYELAVSVIEGRATIAQAEVVIDHCDPASRAERTEERRKKQHSIWWDDGSGRYFSDDRRKPESAARGFEVDAATEEAERVRMDRGADRAHSQAFVCIDNSTAFSPGECSKWCGKEVCLPAHPQGSEQGTPRFISVKEYEWRMGIPYPLASTDPAPEQSADHAEWLKRKLAIADDGSMSAGHAREAGLPPKYTTAELEEALDDLCDFVKEGRTFPREASRNKNDPQSAAILLRHMQLLEDGPARESGRFDVSTPGARSPWCCGEFTDDGNGNKTCCGKYEDHGDREAGAQDEWTWDAARCIAWLDQKYKRHNEEGDYQSAKMMRELSRPAPAVAQPVASFPKVYGTGRVSDNAKALLVHFAVAPSDDELRDFDEYIKGRASLYAHPPAGQKDDGMVRVPRDPTGAMIVAGANEAYRFQAGSAGGAIGCYRAMLAAASAGKTA